MMVGGARGAAVMAVTVALVGVLGACGGAPPGPGPATTPASPAPTAQATTDRPASTKTPASTPTSTSTKTPSVKRTTEAARPSLTESQLKKALIAADDIGPGWKTMSGGGDSGVWPCDEEPDTTADATAVRKFYHPGSPETQASVSLAAYEDSDAAADFLDELRDNIADCEDEPVDLGGGIELSFKEIELLRSNGNTTDSEVLSVAIRQEQDGRFAADGVIIFIRIEDVVGSAQVIAQARRSTAMDQVAIQIARLQLERAADKLGRSA
ncbi:hypothetical protein AB0J72_34670 [Dactylosporangium sp. NPDC049742]|uniref:hypothetical protein n=1 Tax=Dactylosporangium sp. NPDC049742 TaxID=3154737 RepID=UPI00343DE571